MFERRISGHDFGPGLNVKRIRVRRAFPRAGFNAHVRAQRDQFFDGFRGGGHARFKGRHFLDYVNI
jgi:hypothetical protein